MRGIAKLVVPLGIVAAIALLAASGAQAATARIKLTPALSHPSAVVKVTGTGFKASTGITIDFDSTAVASTTSDIGGAFSTTFTVPPTATPGTHTVTASDGTNSAHKTFTVETDWNHFGYDNTNTGDNPYENIISATTPPSTIPTWTFTTGGLVAQPAIVGGVAYFGSTDHNLYAVDIKTHTKLWNFTAGDNITTTPVVDGPTVYFGSIDNYLYAVNKTTGVQEWKTLLNGHIASSPTVANGDIYVGSNNHQVIALDSAGNILWATTTGNNVLDSPTVVGSMVYAGSQDGDLYAIHAASGLIKWQKSYDINPMGSLPYPIFYSPAYANGTLYISDGPFVHAVNPGNGKKMWTYKLHFGKTAYNPAGVAVADGSVYFGCACGTVTALNATTHAVEWQKFWDSTNQSLTVANGVVFLPGNDSMMRGLNAASGASVWGPITQGLPVGGLGDAWEAPAISDGVVYAGASDGNLYAFKP